MTREEEIIKICDCFKWLWKQRPNMRFQDAVCDFAALDLDWSIEISDEEVFNELNYNRLNIIGEKND